MTDKNDEKGVSSFTYDLLERESQSDEQRERREVRRKKLEDKTKVKDPAREKRAKNRRKTLLVLVLLVLVAAAWTARSVQRMVALSQERAAVQAQLDELEKRRSELENELLMVNSDEYVEQQARSQLHMIKPGEVLYIVPNNTEYSMPVEEEPAEGEPESSPAEGVKP
ncbi:MAG: septum formation initiator family protein [Firmicutes bacterium]|nr:septum formation initiator family protein [Bacillota bacterium]MBR3719675.1 septum formation initiator family protein [Bacillota bacterium]